MSYPAQLLFDMLNNATASSGGTSQGVSADIKALGCGMAEAFSASVTRPATIFPLQVLDGKGKPKVVGHRAGSAFHALQELVRKDILANVPGLPANSIIAEQDASVAAAVFAFTRYMSENAFDWDFLGSTVGIEFPFSGTVAGKTRTGRADRVVNATEVHVDRWAEFGIYGAQPGVYLWDYKLLFSLSDNLVEKYQRSVQALMYMDLYEQTTGVRPLGFVHELVSRAANPKLTRMLVITHNIADRKILEHFVSEADFFRERGSANVSACDSNYGPCPFVKYCPRSGFAKDHAAAIEMYKASRASLNILDDLEGE